MVYGGYDYSAVEPAVLFAEQPQVWIEIKLI